MIKSLGGQNRVSPHLVNLLQQNNLVASSNSSFDCAFLQEVVTSWLFVAATEQPDLPRKQVSPSLLWAQLEPVRCPFQSPNGIITICSNELNETLPRCNVWSTYQPGVVNDATPAFFASQLNVRVGGITQYSAKSSVNGQVFEVSALFDENNSATVT
jgi:hypothetical protein